MLVRSALDAAPELDVVGDTGHADVGSAPRRSAQAGRRTTRSEPARTRAEALVAAIARAAPEAAIVAYSGRDPQRLPRRRGGDARVLSPKTMPLTGDNERHIVAICAEMVHELRSGV